MKEVNGMSEKEENEAEEITSFAATALRAPRKSTFDQLLCQHLILSVTAKPLKKISLVSQATMMVDSDKIKNQEELTRIYRVARAFASASYIKLDQWGTRMWYIPWDFPSTEQNFNDFIKPWHIHVGYFPDHIKFNRQVVWKIRHSGPFSSGCNYVLATVQTKDEIKDVVKKLLAVGICPKCNDNLRERSISTQTTTAIKEEPLWSFFFEMSGTCLSEQGFKMLRNSFISWVMPLIQKAVAELSELVTPQQYEDMLKLLTKQGEVKDEGSLGSRE